VWDPGQYLRYATERGRPFFDLMARVAAEDPRYVVDLGCGPGNLTATLSVRWPAADVLGVDSSAEMIGTARSVHCEASSGQASRAGSGKLEFTLGDIRDWHSERPVDVLVSNAALQWVPGHDAIISQWPGMLSERGWLAFQLPGNFDQPTHTVLRDLASSDRWRPLLPGVQLNRQAGSPDDYLDLLARAGCEVDAWETTYLHVLRGPDAIVEWYRGSGLRPVLSILGEADAEEFTAAYRARIAEAYPVHSYGTVLPFRRVFVVARRG
jgi:trans-aconitate 2-methyltransferase